LNNLITLGYGNTTSEVIIKTFKINQIKYKFTTKVIKIKFKIKVINND